MIYWESSLFFNEFRNCVEINFSDLLWFWQTYYLLISIIQYISYGKIMLGSISQKSFCKRMYN